MNCNNPTVAEFRASPGHISYRTCQSCGKFAACEYLPDIDINGVPVANHYPIICAQCKRGFIIDWLAEHKLTGGAN